LIFILDQTIRLRHLPVVPGDSPYQDIGRQHPARGVHIYPRQPTIVFLNVCLHDRKPRLARPEVHQHLRAAWQEATAWVVGYYLNMPDHLHLFCAPRDLTFTFDGWTTFWERNFRRLHQDPAIKWQRKPFHHRLRQSESYSQKWNYVRENPVRAGLVQNPDDWPYQGELTVLPW
jgi:putative transposase